MQNNNNQGNNNQGNNFYNDQTQTGQPTPPTTSFWGNLPPSQIPFQQGNYPPPQVPFQGNYPPPPPMPGQFQYQTVPAPQPPQKRNVFRWYKRQKKAAKIGIGCGTLFLVVMLCGTISGTIVNATGANNVAQVPTAAPTHVASVAKSQPTHQTAKPTAIVKPTNTPVPTTVPTQVPTSVPTAIPTAVPTQAPVATTAPTQPPAQTGVNGNPWGYNFVPGNTIYAPASAFCSYFTCVSTFWKDTSGYVVECVNGRYSHSGGVSGACSRDGGEGQTLYSY